MWIGHFKIFHDNCINLKYTRKYAVVDSLYPLNHYEETGYMHISSLHLLSGETSEKKKFIEDYASDPRTVEIAGEGSDFFISHVKTKKSDRHTFPFYEGNFFFLRPVIHTDVEDWLVGAWSKKHLSAFYKVCSKYFEVKFASITQERVSTIYIPHLTPTLTAKQKEALELACLNGYYAFPRKIHLNELAKKLGISRISLQERLHNAEGKVLSEMLKTL